MAALDSQTSFALISREPTSIQPGGGLCMSLELAWGRLRRAYLRFFRPTYVRQMIQRRQGHCKDCPHDIIDARDLKPYRNVCGYWFAAHDDSFQWREHLGLARSGLAELVCFSLVFLAFTALFGIAGPVFHNEFLWLPLALIIPLWGFVISFFRDPRRLIPTDPSALVSPADGTVTHVEEADEADFPGGRALRISIFLSVFNVHVNRVPRTSRVVRVRYFPGCYLDARHSECAVRNEQLWVDLEEVDTARFLRVKQVSGAIARRIVCWLRPGEQVYAGDRFGMIKFGSRTEVLLPAGEAIDVRVKVGDKVKGGSTVLLSFKESHRQ
jgi:phosphatidylserine decarboxylase